MNDRILDYVNSNFPYKFEHCKKLLDDWNGSKMYVVNSDAERGLYLGFPIVVSDTNGKLEIVENHKEILRILSKSEELNKEKN
ncbi:MAG: hypothetical protein UIB61_07725 [Treponema sp.]|nr:hypothetical protein [Treponema sp.]